LITNIAKHFGDFVCKPVAAVYSKNFQCQTLQNF